MVNILLNMIKVDFKERLIADSCLERGYYNGLFKKTRDSYIIGVNDTEVNTLKDVTLQAEEADNGTKTPTLRSL